MRYELRIFRPWVRRELHDGPEWEHFWSDREAYLSWPSDSTEITVPMLRRVIEVFAGARGAAMREMTERVEEIRRRIVNGDSVILMNGADPKADLDITEDVDQWLTVLAQAERERDEEREDAEQALAERDAALAEVERLKEDRERVLHKRRWIGVEPAEGPIVMMSEQQWAQHEAALAQAERERDNWKADFQEACRRREQVEREREELQNLSALKDEDRLRLQRELDALRGIDRMMAPQVKQLIDERDAAQAEVERLKDESRTFEARWMAAANEVERLTKIIEERGHQFQAAIEREQAALARVRAAQVEMAKLFLSIDHYHEIELERLATGRPGGPVMYLLREWIVNLYNWPVNWLREAMRRWWKHLTA